MMRSLSSCLEATRMWRSEARRKSILARLARAEARASQLAPIVADIRASGIISWYGISRELNKRGVPTATGRGIWEPGRVRKVMERAERGALVAPDSRD